MSLAMRPGDGGVGNEAGAAVVLVASTALAVLFAACSSVPVSPPGDGASTGTGPAVILTGDFPDPTVVRDGSTYYMTHSSFDRVPGLLIWRSSDLYNWEPLTHALRRHVGNVWAPDLIKHGDLFYLYFPAGGTNWVTTAAKPEGPWSEPIDLEVGGIDPGHVAGPDGRRYLHLNGGRAVELAADGLSVLGNPSKVYDGWDYPSEWITECFCLESPKLLHHEGFYYLTSAQGGTAGPSTSHMVVSARSKSPLGPWENSPLNPIVRTWSRLEPWWSKGHGTVIEGPDDQWYIVYHGYENGYRTMGRQTLVEPVKWTDDGWYDISSPDGEEFKAGSVRNYRLQSEDFEGAELPLQWHFDGIDSTGQYSISDGAVEFDAAGDRPRVLHALASDHNYEAELTIDIDGSPEVGFVLYYGRDAFAGIGYLDGQVVLIKGGQPFLRDAMPCAGCRHFKIRMFEHDVALYFSEDGSDWIQHPRGLEVSGFQTNNLGGFSSLKLGVYAKGSGTVRVEDFQYRVID